MAEKINICIVHYNTPKLTECLVRSINKFTPNCTIYIFDNSDKLPFTYRQDNVVVLNNTKGQYVDFNEWLKKYPSKNLSGGKLNSYGSAKHCYSVELCMNIIGENFILLDSDVLITKDISPLFNDKYIYVGEVVAQPKSTIKRVLPYVCFINVIAAKKHGIHYFNENYMHGLHHTKINKSADLYDTGAYFCSAASKLASLKIKWEDYCVHYGSASWIEEKRADKRKVATKMTAAEFLEKNKKLWMSMETSTNKNKKVIYTCITGSYELLDDPFVISPGYDYVCFTNYDKIKSNIWEIRPIPEELNGLSEVKKQRCIKICPHKYLPEYDFSIWVDGSVKLKKDVNEYVNKNIKNGSVFIPAHPSRNCIYKEAATCISMKKDTAENINKQIDAYKKEGFPANYGLVQTNIVLRYHNEPDCIKLMDAWWNEVKNGSHRDQLSFNYALWKNPDARFVYVDKRLCTTEYFKWDNSHGKRRNTPKPIYRPSNIAARSSSTTANISTFTPHAELKNRSHEEIKAKAEITKITKIRTVNYPPSLKRKMLSKQLRTFLKP